MPLEGAHQSISHDGESPFSKNLPMHNHTCMGIFCSTLGDPTGRVIESATICLHTWELHLNRF